MQNKINPETFAASTLALLQADPGRYVNFGVYWYFVKALMKKYYDRNNLGLLGDYYNPDTMARMPEFDGIQPALEAAIGEYQRNSTYNLNAEEVEDPTGGGTLTLIDEDF